MNRFLSKREKDGGDHQRAKSQDKQSSEKGKKRLKFSHSVTSISAAFTKPQGKSAADPQTSFSTVQTTSTDSRPGFFLQTRPNLSDGFIAGLFKGDPQKKVDKELSQQISAIKLRLSHNGLGYSGIEDEQIVYAINSKHANGDLDKAYDLMLLFQASVEGIIKPFDPKAQMLGAENRHNVTCYLDSLLFAMFARLGSFEPILYKDFREEPDRRLSTLIRLWVNMLRSGMLIQTDVTQFLQEALAACGWTAAAEIEQQDVSEAFQFITEKLKLPLLTLKMDIYHTGAEDDTGDHKLIQERLLEVAVPDEVPGAGVIRLEDCLENYFNNRIEVRRHLERSNTLSSIRSGYESPSNKDGSQHIEVRELSWTSPNTPISASAPSTPLSPSGRFRAGSIIRNIVVQDDSKEATPDTPSTITSLRKGSTTRKEVLMPAWQFFNLIPWYTKTQPTEPDANMLSHFAETRPVLGICLKRYDMKDGCTPVRKNTFIDIPLDTRLPHFVEDEGQPQDAPLMGDFKLSLQSVICHRGNSVNSGHYISFIRASEAADGDIESARQLSDSNSPPHYSPDQWLKFDDLHDPRVEYVDIKKALKDEMPYLLFYQVQPTVSAEPDPPSYTDSAIGMHITQSSPSLFGTPPAVHPGYFDGSSTPAIRLSGEVDRQSESRRSVNFDEDRRGSLAFTDASLNSTASSFAVTSQPVTPNEESTAQRMSRAAQRFTKSGSKSRPTSSSGENRISATFSRTINLMKSKDQLNKFDTSKEALPVTDGAADRRASISFDGPSTKNAEETGTQSKNKKGKKRDKSKGPLDKSESDHHHHSLHRGKGKERDVPDRECISM